MDFTNIKIRRMRNSVQDAEFVVRIRNHPDVMPKFYNDKKIDIISHQNFLEESNKRGDLLFVIEKDDELVGVAALDHINMVQKRIEWGRLLLDPSKKGTGLGAYIEFNMLDYAFEVLGAEKVYCEVLDDNLEVVKLHENFGFIKEGFFREHLIKNGVRRSIYYMGLLKREWNRERFVKMFGERKVEA